jgi:hypothetical protein
MQDVLVWSARIYPATALVLLGCGLVASELLSLPTGSRRRRGWPDWALFYLYGFRRIVVGVCMAGAGVAWAEQVDWLLAVCICVGIGELLESSYYIAVLEWGKRRGSLTSG